MKELVETWLYLLGMQRAWTIFPKPDFRVAKFMANVRVASGGKIISGNPCFRIYAQKDNQPTNHPTSQPTNHPASQPANQPTIGLWTGQNFWLASLDMLFAWNQSFFKSEPPQKFHSVMFDQRLSQNGRLRHWFKILVSPYHWHHQLDWVSGTAASPSSSLKKVSPMT